MQVLPRIVLLAGFTVMMAMYCSAAALVIPGADVDPLAMCVALNSSICEQHVAGLSIGAPIYTNSTMTQELLVAAVEASLQTSAILTQVAPRCAEQLQKFICLGYLVPCNYIDTGSTLGVVAMPARACYNACEAMEALCKPTFDSLGSKLPNCPAEEYIYDFTAEGGTNVTANCTTFYDASGTDSATCPLSISFYGHEKPHRLRIICIVFGYFSFVLCALVAVFTAANPKLRKWPSGILVTIQAIGMCLLSLGCLMVSWTSIENLHCNQASRYVNLCRAQGFMIIAGLHFTVTTWMVMTVITAISVWSSNPQAAMKASYKYRYYIFLVYIIPTAFIIYCCTDLGGSSVSILCATHTARAQERGMTWPLAGEVFIGTVCWVLAVIASLKAFGFGNGKLRDLRIYVRLLLYELVAIIPSALFIIPFQLHRKAFDSVQHADPSFIKHTLWNLVILATMAAFLAPTFFGMVFLTRYEHYRFLSRAWSKSSFASTSRKTSSQETDLHPTSKF